MEAARTLKANLKLDGKPCGWCQVALRLGDDASVCSTCEKEHHSRCWESNAGCSTQGCLAAPLRRLDAAPQGGSPYSQSQAQPPSIGSPFPQGGGSPYSQGSPYGGASSSAAAPPPGYMNCPNCRVAIMVGTQVCPSCRAITTPDGLYHGPKVNAPGAVASLVCGLIGLVFCGIILGPIAISRANTAKQSIASDPTLGGEGLATAGMILGIIDLVLFVIYMLLKFSTLK
jgi:hypothetical protein